MNCMSMDSGARADRAALPVLAVLLPCCLLFPLAGVLLTGQPLADYLHFPPLTRQVEHAPWNGAVFLAGLLVLLPVLACLAGTMIRRWRPVSGSGEHGFPWWGSAGLVLVAISWILAWNRFPWFRGWQAYTFTPLWLGYILVVNGLVHKWTGTSLPERNLRGFLILFPASALFWWYFEYLNRFVQNWYYLGIETFSSQAYVLHATVCFSTVLPAVEGTRELLEAWQQPVGRRQPPGRQPQWIGWLLLLTSMAGLAGLAAWPDLLFPLVWVSPFTILAGIQGVRDGRICPVLTGWPALATPALAGLVCGFFWEMWNWKSLAHWEYAIPWVDRYHLFAMPLLGYGGYLPFGAGCCCLARLVTGRSA